MTPHTCLLCLGSNLDAAIRLSAARSALLSLFPDIRFSPEMVTEAIGSGFLSPFHNQVAHFTTLLNAESIRAILKDIEQAQGRLPEDKANGIVKLDIDLLMYDDCVLKPKDMEREFVIEGIKMINAPIQ
ncbi:MAG: 2-amino-4-hydroxy-6-hydroxymethyldihydropteridine diphosphokinase [Bacteroides sp.]|nr:2-amino-4-hydroxy-6-hydroxymethyldihydropteridine diphosphokinase [Bacteroides sp.]